MNIMSSNNPVVKLIRELDQQMNQAQLFMVASSLAYTTILSIIPALAVSFAIFKIFGGMDKLYGVIEPLILSYLVKGTGDEVLTTVHQMIDQVQVTTLGLGGMLGLIVTSMAMFSSIEKAINRVWHLKVTRHFFHRIASYWLLMTLGPVALAVVIGLATSTRLPGIIVVPGWVGIIGMTVGAFFFAYKFVPQTKVCWQPALIAAAVTAVVWNLASLGYGLYTKRVLTYHTLYGSLAAVPIMLLWIYIMWLVILGGAALTAVLQRLFFEKSLSCRS
jgi:membrane protein